MKQIDNLKTFISSPNDVKKEREILIKTINEINSKIQDSLQVTFESITWEKFAPETPPDKTIQEKLNEEIPKCKFFILVLNKRYGTKEKEHEKGNTEREIDVAIELLKKEQKISILAYLKQLPDNKDKGVQELKMIKFRERLKKEGIWYKEYKSISDFEIKVTNDLYETILRYKFSSKKIAALRKFWKIGKPKKEGLPDIAIIYPAIARIHMGKANDESVWLNRLEPNIVFEDFKALQKVQKTLRLAGFDNYRIFNSNNIPTEVEFINRFWICLPRNSGGRKYSERYNKEKKFNFIMNDDKSNSYILWNNDSGKTIKIFSPLSKYLEIQRSRFYIKGEWHDQLDNIIAKDYAVLSRFKENNEYEDNILYDYFLAGIRGLGTWGAAWFIDRVSGFFNKNDNKDNLQILLEVEYQKGIIVGVKDVSEKPSSYFRSENNLSTIEKNIREYNPSFKN